MKAILLTTFLFSIISTYSSSQGTEKLNLHLAQIMAETTLQQKEINLLIQGDINIIRQLTEMHNGIFRYSVDNIATIKIPVSAINAFASHEKIKRLESPANNYVSMNDSMRSTVRVNEVHAGLAPLLQAFDGTGVVAGIIDTGIDLTHPDMLDSAGNTRVKYLWDQRKPTAANTPSYGYGQEWNNTEIDAGQAVSDDLQGFGHGTHITGIVASDGSANGKNKGVAPGVDIIEVAFDFNNVIDPTYIDAVDYIFSRAQLLGKPCVINASLGSYDGSHDGFDLQSQMISALLNQQAGRAMVAAAGNAGSIPFHLGYTVTNDTSFTWVRHNPAYQSMYFQIWGDTSDFKNIDFSIGADVNTTTSSFRGNLAFRKIFYNLGIFKQDTLFSTNGNRLAIIQSFGSTQGPTYLLEFNIIPDSTTYQWRLMTTGSGRMDMWKFYAGTAQPGFVNTNLPLASIVPGIIHYKLPDSLSTMVSGFQCLDNVITVGNYGNRDWYIDVNGNTYTDPNTTPGQIAANSSWGPTRDGRIKPDIAAPGGIMLSSGPLSLLAVWQTQPSNAPKVAEGGFHFRNGGTSSSSPVVAGIAALFLQQNPTATAMQVKNAIIQCAVQDTFTGTNLPNIIWGHGKVDAFNTLTNCSLTSLENSSVQNSVLGVYPNPVHVGESVIIGFKPSDSQAVAEVLVTDLTGRVIKKHLITPSNSNEISTRGLSAGLYILTLVENGNKRNSVRLTVIQ